MSQAPAPSSSAEAFDFGSASSAGFFALLDRECIALAVAASSAHRVIVFRQWDDEPDTLLLPVARPTALALADGTLSIASQTEIIRYRRRDALLADPGAQIPDFLYADALYLPLERRITGRLQIRDMACTGERCWFASAAYSCLATLEPGFHFRPVWSPSFVDGPVGNGFVHLNGIALQDDRPAYASCFVAEAIDRPWQQLDDDAPDRGALLRVADGRIVAGGLRLPHSPRMHRGQLYFCHGGHGTVERLDPNSGRRETVIELPGYTRGLAFHGEHMFVCTSRPRADAPPMVARLGRSLGDCIAAVFIVDLQRRRVVDYTQFTGDVDQLDAIAVLPGTRSPAIPALGDDIVGLLSSYPTGAAC